MNRLFQLAPLAILGLLAIGAFRHSYPDLKPKPCTCDTLQTRAIVCDPNYDRIPQYDADEFTDWDFYKLDSATNRTLWFRDVESVDSTKLTAYWNDYYQHNYHISQQDFIKYYTGRPDIEMAFLLGPNHVDLWAYHIFVIKKVGCCYVLTRSYFRHARFTYKAYAILNQAKMDSLHILVDKTGKTPMKDTEHDGYAAYFTDNCNQQQYFIDLQKKPAGDTAAAAAQADVRALLRFVDKGIAWNKTYPMQ
jgi:hypothetical protein